MCKRDHEDASGMVAHYDQLIQGCSYLRSSFASRKANLEKRIRDTEKMLQDLIRAHENVDENEEYYRSERAKFKKLAHLALHSKKIKKIKELREKLELISQ